MRLCAFFCVTIKVIFPLTALAFALDNCFFPLDFRSRVSLSPSAKSLTFFQGLTEAHTKRFFPGLFLKAWKVYKKALDVAFNCHVTCVEKIVIEVIFAT